MKYLVLIYANEQLDMTASEAEQAALIAEYGAFDAWMATTATKNLGGEALMPTMTAKSVRVRNGKVSVTDGPFAETKEQLGGFYVIDANDLEAALEVAARVPNAKNGCIEVRPVITFGP
jgi:hypothetical protein